MPFLLGKKPHQPGAISFRYADIFDKKKLTKPPLVFGHVWNETKIDMLGNDKAGCCVWSTFAHLVQTMQRGLGSAESVFTPEGVLSDYSTVSGYIPGKPETDQGTYMAKGAAYWRQNGVVDGDGMRHKIAAYVDVKLDPDELMQACFDFGGVALGLKLPVSAITQFKQGRPWSVPLKSETRGRPRRVAGRPQQQRRRHHRHLGRHHGGDAELPARVCRRVRGVRFAGIPGRARHQSARIRPDSTGATIGGARMKETPMLRRTFLTGAAALALAGCSGGTPTTIGNVIAEVKKQCAFAPNLDAIIKVVTTLVSGFNAEAGAATIIAAAIGKQIVDMVCNAVKTQAAQLSVEKKALPSQMVVVVNGVHVPGAYGASS